MELKKYKTTEKLGNSKNPIFRLESTSGGSHCESKESEGC